MEGTRSILPSAHPLHPLLPGFEGQFSPTSAPKRGVFTMVKLAFVKLGEDQSKRGSRDTTPTAVCVVWFASTQLQPSKLRWFPPGKGGGGDQQPPDLLSAMLQPPNTSQEQGAV